MEIIERFLGRYLELGNFEEIQFQKDEGVGFEPGSQTSDSLGSYEHLLYSVNQKQCYRNSLLASLIHNDLEYWEGYYITEGLALPIGHAFNVKAVKFDIKVEYYYGVKIPREVLQEYMSTDQILTAQYYLKEFYKKD